MKPLDFKTSGYFPGTFIFTAVILCMVAVPVIFMNIIAGLIMLLVSVIIFTTHYRFSLDLEHKVFHDHVWILGFRSGEKKKFERIEYLFIKTNTVSQTMNLKAASTTIRKEVYDGYIKFSENEKVHLITKDSKKDLITKLLPISKALNVKVIDYSSGAPEEVQ